MNHSTRKKPLSLTALIVAISMANSSISFATPASNDKRVNLNGSITNVDLTGDKHAILNWTSFDLALDESVIFNQQGSDSVAVNNISGSASQIFGSIKANGHVFLVNNNGFTFGQNAVIDTQGFLATTFSLGLNDDNVLLTDPNSGTGTGKITLGNLDIANDTQYIAFYSENIDVTGNVQDNSTGNDALLSLNTQTSAGSITLPGLAIGFSADTINPSNQNLTIKNNSLSDHGSLVSNNGTVTLSSKNLSDLFTGSVQLPELISAKSIRISANDTIDIKSNVIASEKDIIKNLNIESNNEIIVTGKIYGTDLNLELSGTSINVKEGTNENEQYSLIGGIGGLKNITLNTTDNAGSITIADNIKAKESMFLNGNLDLKITSIDQKNILFDAGKIFKSQDISLNSKHDVSLRIKGNNASLGSITRPDTSKKDGRFNNIDITSGDITLGGTYSFINSFDIDSNNTENSIINISKDTQFIGDKINFRNPIFNIKGPENTSITFGSSEKYFSEIALKNISMHENSEAFKSINMHVKYIDKNNSNDTSLSINGDLKTKKLAVKSYTANGIESNERSTINIAGDFNITELTTLDFANFDLNASDYDLTFTGSSIDTSTIDIGNISGGNVNISQFKTLNATGSFFDTESLIINAPTINLSNSNTNEFSLTSKSGPLIVSSSINSNQKEIDINSGTGGFTLNGIHNAKSISLENSPLTNRNTTQSLSGNYIAEDSIIATGLGSVSVRTNSKFESKNIINLKNTTLSSNNDITIIADTVDVDDINAKNITIKNSSDANNLVYSTNLNLWGDLISSENISLFTKSINLQNDLTIKGNINFLDEKQYTDAENKTGLVYSNSTIAPPSINGTKHLTLDASNESVYLYKFGDVAPLSSLTLNGEGTLHMIDRPNIIGQRGLSILGNWDWTLLEPLAFTTENQDLNLSGVNLNAVGSITFDTGSGSLSLGSIGSNGTVTDLIIDQAGTLNLHGDIKLVGSTFGYNFSNVNAINLFKDMTFGSEEEPVIVNLGDSTIDGTFDLNIYSDDITIGEIGSNIALQDLNIFSASDLVLNESITLVGNANINANSINIQKNITSTGLDIHLNSIANITMSKLGTLNSDFGNISLTSQTGNIGLGAINAKGDVLIQSDAGYIFNAIDDYVSNDLTSVNITSNNLTMLGKLNIGQSVASPIVIDIKDNGIISTESDGDIYIANLANAGINSKSRVIDTSSQSGAAIVDAYNFLSSTSINSLIEPHYKTTLGLIENSSWQVDEDESVKTIKTPSSSPNLYYSRKGWRLGY